MIDIHSHILPGVDDGSPDLLTSIKMAEIAVSEGFTRMIATPHFIEKDQEIDSQLILEKTKELNKELTSRLIDVEILPGQEILLTPNLVELFSAGKLMTLGDSGLYLLIELPMMSIPLYALDVIHDLRLRGLEVILAHPERNLMINKDLDKLKKFIKMGVLAQVNSLSLIGVFGKEAKLTAEKIIKEGMAHFIATDCHTARARSPRIKEVLKTIPAEAIKLLLIDNPTKVLKGKRIDSKQMAYDGGGLGVYKRLSLFFNNLT
ncbi:MAG: CpsB/CapC family capsule biosynthesis tyrosine phosphatase [Bacillota bacterium]